MGNFNRDNSSGRSGFGNRGFGGGNSDREMFKATCADCGNECEIPFRPTNGRPVYCNNCFKKNSPQDYRGGRDNFSRDRRGNTADRPMFDAKCDNCGNDCKVPFAPREGKDTLCSKCFEEKGGDPRRSTNGSAQQLDEINTKLDRILELLSPTPKASKKVAKLDQAELISEVEEISAPTEELVEEAKPKAKKKAKKSE